ncbi:hypothetical protein G7B40_025865 [Aetokthonos hydrillicola Thurmond2011]|jgi:hypothetical protein|uniref:Uncharacterized protein n=1 Tax=Aetokthonos hydrillicola Thurmond2011 TaxID=2712845 RepID=A0AAP5MC73_9CYAN|nr:hypothetical protein [Aetokthonos hydrillicola]MBO3460656.1 hypothetical protein [Aetokthonos hydrillicola CCALA 1050]MBW4587655.1 hypothetical protein [Aetokthonos hydrillicola CCALA 1050]MDR9897963.1 hypothetical protein [Aetokthonos hydrillicola Thurmond2011]
MANKINGSETLHPLSSQVELEFLEALLEPDDATYPWDPADEESETYFFDLEEHNLMQDVLETELIPRSQAFYNQLDNLWSNYRQYNSSTSRSLVNTLQEALQSNFGSHIPTNWLNKLSVKATEVFGSTESISEKLIQCVQSVLPTWEAEDLLVLARPFAYAMRSSESQSIETLLDNAENREWTSLSEIEQAKASLAIAQYALTELSNFQEEA